MAYSLLRAKHYRLKCHDAFGWGASVGTQVGLSWQTDSECCRNAIEKRAGDCRKQRHAKVTARVHKAVRLRFGVSQKCDPTKTRENVNHNTVYMTTLSTLKYVQGSAKLAGCHSLFFVDIFERVKEDMRLKSC